MSEYTAREMMAIAAARQIKNGDVLFCGTGISMLAAMAAKHINAPDSVIIFETGAVDPKLEEIPLAVSDPRIMFWTSINSGLADIFAIMQNQLTGKEIVGILGAAQIDKYGNLNSTVIGDYSEPCIRFSGSGGACDVASFVSRTIIFIQHERRKFVPRLDYLTSPGWLDGPDARQKAGLPEGGPMSVVTNMAVMRFDMYTKEMYLAGYYPGVSPEEILDMMGFKVDISRAKELTSPTLHELHILREVCDPKRLILD